MSQPLHQYKQYKCVNKPVQEAGVVYRYLDRPSTRLSSGHVTKINKPYHSHQQLLTHDDDENAISSAIMKAATEFDFLQERLPNAKQLAGLKSSVLLQKISKLR